MSKNKKTVFITGTSSGIGLASAILFYERGWNVIATMRSPEKRQTLLHERGVADLVHLDVIDKDSIHAAIKYALEKYERIDALVNNAGYAVYGPFEATTQEQTKRQFDTNLFGLMQVTHAMLPVFRGQKQGVIINISSMGGRIGFPLYSVYNGTKWAVEGFSESLRYELKPLNIKVRLIEPGVIKTDFYDRSLDAADNIVLGRAYEDILKRGQKNAGGTAARKGIEPIVVARTIYRAATDSTMRLRYPVGGDAWQAAIMRRLLPERIFYRLLEKAVLD